MNYLPEFGWLIETPSMPAAWANQVPPHQGPAWWSATGTTWVADSSKATRFARREDANAIIRMLGLTNVQAVEHMWAGL